MSTLNEVLSGIKEKHDRMRDEITAVNRRCDAASFERDRSRQRYAAACNQRSHLQQDIVDMNERLAKAEEKRKYVENRLYEKQVYLLSLEEFVSRMTQSKKEDSVDNRRRLIQSRKDHLHNLYQKIQERKERVQGLELKLERLEQRRAKKDHVVRDLEERKVFLRREFINKRRSSEETIAKSDSVEEKVKDVQAAITRKQHDAELFVAHVKSMEKNISEKEKELQRYIDYNKKTETNVREMLPCYMVKK